ncbi:replication factor A [Methanofervidicoccus sp. A16]|uniref:OB-fold nucleic acid binding domain-containing protein n=1 Tax=Methanofervidicoccus sp. A16 TaxID=2607662 RepID=UPI00118D2CDF|nr:OB-fold nucleic acid binding domain-containing protein [Methanofervidicoccus sp. A16]AXI25621.1 replication factor A [Methanofervidicoccus sp. A16]
MDTGKLIEEILKKIPKEELERRIEEKIEESGGLISREAAISIIASELNIDIEDYEDEEFNFSIKDISEGQNNVEITGKIVDISDVREFRKRDGTLGRVRNITIADNTGTIRLVLWDDKVELAEDLKVGDVVRIENAYTRKWRDRIELSSGINFTIEKLDKYREERYPEIKETYTIGELMPGIRARVKGEVATVYEKREFKRRDGTPGKVKAFILRDDTGVVRCTLWDDLSEVEVNIGDIVEVEGYVREGMRGLDIQVDNIEILKKGGPVESPIVDTSQLPNYVGEVVSIKGRILRIFPPRTVEFEDREGKVQDVLLMDKYGSVRVSFWGGSIQKLRDIKEGDTVLIKHCKVKSYLTPEGEEVITLSAQSYSEVVKDETVEVPDYSEELIKIGDIKYLDERFKRDITTVGRVIDVQDIREFKREDGSTGKVRNIVIEDETGSIRVALWDENATIDIKEGDIVKIINGYMREDVMELNVGRYGRVIVNPEGVVVDIKRKFIKELEEGESAEIRGTVVDYIKQEPILYLCPHCNRRTTLDEEGRYVCSECGEVEPREVPVCALILDDGTGNILCRLYGTVVEKVLKMPREELKEMGIEVFERTLGEEFIFSGTVNDRLEFLVRGVLSFNIDREIELLKKIKNSMM